MRKFDRFLSTLLTAAMVLTLFDAPALGMFVSLTGDEASVAVEEGGVGFAAVYDEDGRMLDVGESAALAGDARALKVMEAEGEDLSPRTAPLTLELQDGAYSGLSVPEGSTLELAESATLTGWNRVDGTLAVPPGSALTIAQDGELFIDDVTEDAQGRIALGGVLYSYGWLNVGDWNRRIDAYDEETRGKLYTAWDMNGFAGILGEFFADSPVVSRKSSWQKTQQGAAMLSRLSDEWNQDWAQSVIEGYDILRGCNALDLNKMTEDNNHDPLLTEAMVLEMLSAVWEDVTGEAPVENFAVFDTAEDERYPDETLFACDPCDDWGGWHWEESVCNEVRATLRSCVSSLMASAEHLTIRGDGRGVYAETDEGLRSYDAVEGVTFPNHLTVTVEGSASNRFYTFNGCTFEQGVEVELCNIRDVDLQINDMPVAGAHVFGYDWSYGIYTGMERGEFESNVTDFAVYPGRWNDEAGEPEFPDAPAFTMADTEQYEYNYNDQNGVNINARRDDWISDPYQVRLVMTLANGVTVTYDTLCYKEGWMELVEFASRLRGRLDGALAEVDDDDRAAVTERWEEHEYGDRLDDFAFAVKYGGLQRPDDEDDQGAENYWVTHFGEAWNDLRYGTAKRILEGVYRAAWNDGEHTSLPDSVKLIDENGNEWHRDDDSFRHREIDQMLDALLGVLPRRDNDATTLRVLRRESDGWEYVLMDDAADTEENQWDANLAGLRFTEPVTVEIDESARGEWLNFNNCSFDQGLSVEAPPVIQRENEAGETYYDTEFFSLDFNDNCSGTVVVYEAKEDAAARSDMLGMLRPDIDGERFDRLYYHGAIGLNGAAGLAVRTDARACLSTDGGTVTLNDVEYTSAAHFDLNTNHSDEWTWDEEAEEDRLVAGDSLRVYLSAEGYNERDESSLERCVTLSGVSENDVIIRGMADATGLTLGEGKRLIAEFDHGNWNNTYAILGEGQALCVNDHDWRLDLYVNGERVERPSAEWDEREMRVEVPKGYAASVWQYRKDGPTDIGDELEYIEEEYCDCFYNQEDGWNEEDERWYPLNSDSIHGVQVRYDIGGVTVVYDTVPIWWNRTIGIGELGWRLLLWLDENGHEDLAFNGFAVARYLDPDEELDEASVALLDEIWEDERFHDWAEAQDRAYAAFILGLLPGGVGERYNDPGDTLRWGDAKAALAALLGALGKDEEEIFFFDYGRSDNDFLNEGGRNDLYEQFLDQLPQTPVEGPVTIVLSRDEERRNVCNINGEDFYEEIVAREFRGKVTVLRGENADPEDDWGGELYFRNCAFLDGVEIQSDEALPFRVDFYNACTGAVTVGTEEFGGVEVHNVRGMTVSADNGVSLDATGAEAWAYVNLSRYEASVGADGECVNYAQLCYWGEHVVQLRLNRDFLSEEDIDLRLGGEALPFAPDGYWEGPEYVLVLRESDGGAWFDFTSAHDVTLTLPLSGATLTFAPPPSETEHPASTGDMVETVLDPFERSGFGQLGYLRERYGAAWDEHLTYAAALEILAEAWRTLQHDDGAALPEDIALDGKADGDILKRGEASALVLEGLWLKVCPMEYDGASAEELRELLGSGRVEIDLISDLTLDGDFTVPGDVTLAVMGGATVTVSEGCTLTVEGELVNLAAITGAGTLAVADGGLYVNETADGGEAVLAVAELENSGWIVYFVTEKADGSLTKQEIFTREGVNPDCRAVVFHEKGFDNAAKESYNQCIIAGSETDNELVREGDARFERLVIYGGSTLTVKNGTLELWRLDLRGGNVVLGEGASLNLTGGQAWEADEDGYVMVWDDDA